MNNPQPRSDGPLAWLAAGVVIAIVLGIVALAGGFASEDSGTTSASTEVADPTLCHQADTGAALALRGAVTSDVDVALSDEAVAVDVDGTTYVALPLGSGNSAALVGAYDGSEDDMVAANGLARSHTDLPAGGEQAGIDAALDCL